MADVLVLMLERSEYLTRALPGLYRQPDCIAASLVAQ
jgi:hypothetical protein